MLKISNVETFYGKIQALRGVNIDIKEGEIVSLIGSNGAGKSTLLMTISGVNKAKRGEIVFEGESVYDCWDGTDNRTGFPSPDGEYFGLFIFKNPKNNKTLRRSNVITIIR